MSQVLQRAAYDLGWSYFFGPAQGIKNEDEAYGNAVDYATKYFGYNKVAGDLQDQKYLFFLLGFRQAREYSKMENKFL